jgi:hypothetical protein
MLVSPPAFACRSLRWPRGLPPNLPWLRQGSNTAFRGAPCHRTRLSRDWRLPVASRSSVLLASKQPGSLATLGRHRMICDESLLRTSIPCGPSPCGRLSRPLTTMATPTPLWFMAGLRRSAEGPPTFPLIRSTRWGRQRLHATHPVLHGILNGYGVSRVTPRILWAGNEARPASVTFRFVHWPIGPGLEPGASVPVGCNPLPLELPCHLSAKPGLLAACLCRTGTF